MIRTALAASIAVTLAAASPASAQSLRHTEKKPATPPSRDSLPAPTIATSTAGVTPFAWLDDATVLEPGDVSFTLSAMRWDGADASEVDVPIVQTAIGLTDRVHLTATVPRVVGSGDAAGAVGGVGTSFFSLKIGVIDDRRRGIKVSVSPTLEVLGDGVLQSIEPGVSRVQAGLPVSAEVDRGPVRLFGGAGYFSRGVWFGGGGIGMRASSRLFVSGSFSRSWRRPEAAGAPLADRNEVSAGAAYAVTPRVSVFGSAGRTIATLDENGAGATIGGGVSVFFRAGVK